LSENDFEIVKIRKGTKGWIEAYIHVAQVWVLDGRLSGQKIQCVVSPSGSGYAGNAICKQKEN